MNVNAGHERTSKARIIHQIQLIRGITLLSLWHLVSVSGIDDERGWRRGSHW
ncbi:hypothetical protein [Shigella dysenteriae]|uniref:hypothetical protein n=1 Tax=Shigella dysenteriae TaxID=622 RepID=UPI001304ABA0|nr:hypothetical protein [Shigella dysenteriae]WNT50698.1 hypothetical protein PWP84_21100 [Shigella dysenteriae]